MIHWRGVLIVAVIGIIGGSMAFFFNDSQAVSEPAAQTQTELKPSVLSSDIQMGVVELNVQDLAKQKNFYHDLVGLALLNEDKTQITLGFDQRPVIRLVHTPDLPLFASSSAGLYHSAIVFESKPTLARAVQSVLQKGPQYFSGSSDHVVSEAFYFTDPEGNGVELYTDRDPSTWIWKNGKVSMGSTYIDPAAYIAQYANASSTETKKMGHIHLQIGNIAEAKKFYSDILGLAMTADMPTALFMSDGKYHHNLGMNIWQSEGAGKRTPSTGLKSFELQLALAEDLNKLKERLTAASVQFTENDGKLEVRDPWDTVIVFTIQK